MSTVFRSIVKTALGVVARRSYATQATSARINRKVDYEKTPILYKTEKVARDAYGLGSDGALEWQNLNQAVCNAMHHALKTDDNVILFGEDVAFGGVFRCSKGLADEFGGTRVFNTPLTEQGIAGFGIGCAAQGMKPIAEIQFADYVFPAFDQIVNEAAKFRYREGGVRVVMPRSPSQAKGMLISSILNCNDPVIFMEPKTLYRAAEEFVPRDAFSLPLDKAEILKEGTDLTVISYGQPLYLCSEAIQSLEKEIKGLSIELVDLRAIYPWDRETVLKSVNKTGRAVIVHESMLNAGVGAEMAASIQEGSFLHLEAPVARVTGWDVHPGLVFEKYNIPDVLRIYDTIKRTLNY
ncbi:hypothetical protein LTR51_000871 [Lithohypha guttulata]|uniref:3-methyl-2-oxobutanoate dehydrogenase (2-methylpropanoyl-transferring) n=1 Tax=Lithohypha guttulata TaxID=1690604 RepID=A0AAN7SXW0_9EURO|nr:hypothetical protein LTR51_000871 [Lithohypha guttulata]KAK5083924.1 hypothetical protein LTR05_006431 [Lithohypha guttulata]